MLRLLAIATLLLVAACLIVSASIALADMPGIAGAATVGVEITALQDI